VLADNVNTIADHYSEPTDKEIDLISWGSEAH